MSSTGTSRTAPSRCSRSGTPARSAIVNFKPIPGFPATVDDMDRLTANAVDTILDHLDGKRDGLLFERKERLKSIIGLVKNAPGVADASNWTVPLLVRTERLPESSTLSVYPTAADALSHKISRQMAVFGALDEERRMVRRQRAGIDGTLDREMFVRKALAHGWIEIIGRERIEGYDKNQYFCAPSAGPSSRMSAPPVTPTTETSASSWQMRQIGLFSFFLDPL
ncbi:hypothetical protein BFW01_g5922 [Lasiodiplodia theobromae]|nr:hypothetical protein BFW01_g5922 [Lasiodiplodia theobromae]